MPWLVEIADEFESEFNKLADAVRLELLALSCLLFPDRAPVVLSGIADDEPRS